LAGIPANKDTKLSSGQIVDFIRGKHRENSQMPVWKEMPTEEAGKIAAYLKRL
jgi:mono/diheme cytochrome c family protein